MKCTGNLYRNIGQPDSRFHRPGTGRSRNCLYRGGWAVKAVTTHTDCRCNRRRGAITGLHASPRSQTNIAAVATLGCRAATIVDPQAGSRRDADVSVFGAHGRSRRIDAVAIATYLPAYVGSNAGAVATAFLIWHTIRIDQTLFAARHVVGAALVKLRHILVVTTSSKRDALAAVAAEKAVVTFAVQMIRAAGQRFADADVADRVLGAAPVWILYAARIGLADSGRGDTRLARGTRSVGMGRRAFHRRQIAHGRAFALVEADRAGLGHSPVGLLLEQALAPLSYGTGTQKPPSQDSPNGHAPHRFCGEHTFSLVIGEQVPSGLQLVPSAQLVHAVATS